tara:strand:- start:1228 stop:1821 length:594 start_codon:yes stop_codon:yes gene_type:complete
MKWEDILKRRIERGQDVGSTFAVQMVMNLMDEGIDMLQGGGNSFTGGTHLDYVLLQSSRNPEEGVKLGELMGMTGMGDDGSFVGRNGWKGFKGITRISEIQELVEQFPNILALCDAEGSRLDFIENRDRFGRPNMKNRVEVPRHLLNIEDILGKPRVINVESPDYDIPDPKFVSGNREIFNEFMTVYTRVEESIGRN